MKRAFAATLGTLVLGSVAHAQYPMPAYPQQMMMPQQQMMMPQQQMMMPPMQYMPMQAAPMQYVPMGNGQVMPVAAYRQPMVPVMMVPVRVPAPTAPMIAPVEAVTENGPLDPEVLAKAGAQTEMPAEHVTAEPAKKATKDEPVPRLYKKLWPFNRTK